MKKIFIISVSLLTLFLGSCKQDNSIYPSKQVSVIVPYSAGGGSDSIVRALVDSAKEFFPKNIIIVNKTGGAGALGMLYGANSKPDGYTVSMIAVELTILPHLGTGGNLDPSLFTPILMFNSDYSVIAVQADSTFNNLENFITEAREKTPKIGNSGVGSIWNFAAAALAKNANVEFSYIPFDGSAPAITSLLGGHIDAVSVSYPEVAPYVKSGDLKILGTLSETRIAEFSDLLTAKEQGYDVSVGTWRGFGVPKGTPAEVVAKLQEIFTKAAESDSFKTFMSNNGFGIEIEDSETFSKRIENNMVLYEALSKEVKF